MKVEAQDPFGEHAVPSSRARLAVLGAEILVESTDAALMELAIEAYGGLPPFEKGHTATALGLSMVLNDHGKTWPAGEIPPAPILSSGSGLLCASFDAGNFAVVDPAHARAFINVSRAMLQHPHIIRYELIEFAILTLASRSRSLVPLHAACVGLGANGCLILGASGTGKSTLCLMALEHDLSVLSEDSTFVDPMAHKLFGVPNFLHVKRETLALLEPGSLRGLVEQSRLIYRRSGATKFEMDLRRLGQGNLENSVGFAATIFLTQKTAGSGSALEKIDRADMLTRMIEEQPYAVGLPGWDDFCETLVDRPAYELRRTNPPAAAIRELRALLAANHVEA